MTVARPLLIATLPGRTVSVTRAQAAEARAAGADIAEVRLDRWTAGERERVHELFPTPIPLLATLRSRVEGGEGPNDPDERSRTFERLAKLPFEGVDLEFARDRSVLDRLPSGRPPLRIASVHLPEGTPSSEVSQRLRAELPTGTVRKVVLPASIRTVLRELLPVLPPAGDGPRVLLTTGASGALLRAWAFRLGYPYVFASLPPGRNGAAPGSVEASQIPVDRMHAFLEGGPSAPLFALAGHPVAHSQSPYLHDRWMRAAGVAGLYVALDIESEEEFVESLPVLAEGGFRGVNVTHPWKSVALASASQVGRAAEVCAVANCLTFRGEEVEADNTDLSAILRRLEEYRSDGRWMGRELAIVGAGGAAAATLAAARELNAEAFVVARDPEEATPIAARFGGTLLDRRELRPFDLVVHATPVGRSESGSLDVPIDRLLSHGGHLLDWVYAPESAEVREAANRAGAAYEDGWRLLVYQAAASFGLWWGAEPSPEEIESTAREGPCAA
jgi:shikimate dehydrogenase